MAQTAGRGRLDRSWASPPGNLYASLLLRDPSPLERAPRTRLRRGAWRCATPSSRERRRWRRSLRFKWPNDLLARRRQMRRHSDRRRSRAGQRLARRHRHRRQLRNAIRRTRAYPGDRSCRRTAPTSRRNGCSGAVRHHVPAYGAWDRGARLSGYPRRLARRGARHRRGHHGAQWRQRKARPLCRSRPIRPARSANCAAAALEMISAGDVFPFERAGARRAPEPGCK